MVKLQIDALASCACTVFRFCSPPESFFLRWALSFAYMFSVWLCACPHWCECCRGLWCISNIL